MDVGLYSFINSYYINRMKDEAKKLYDDIKAFVEKYAAISPNFDPEDNEDEDGKYTGPDVYQLLDVCSSIKLNLVPEYPNSSWESGCYAPYTSLKGREEHNILKQRISGYIQKFK